MPCASSAPAPRWASARWPSTPEADRHALHVKRADEAHSVGDDPLAGYLNPRKLVNLAVETGCDALHPGYGFLSENAELAEICAERGIKFIGPSAEVIRRMGDKTEARRSMIKAGVPVTPGTEGNVADLAEALREAERLGYPVMLRLLPAAAVAFAAATVARSWSRPTRG